MKTILNRIVKNKTGFLLALAALLIVGGWRVFAIVHKPAHWREAAAELVLPHIRTLMVNHNNTSLAYTQDSENDNSQSQGGGFYFYDIAAEKKTFLYEETTNGRSARLFGWSPDDSYFAYSKPVESYLKREFFICDGKTCKTVAELPAPGDVLQFAWLSPHSFAYLQDQHLVEVEQNQDGQWTQSRAFNHVGKDADYFTALNGNSVAWQAARKIYSFDLLSGASQIIWESSTNQLVNFTYSMASGQFVLRCRDTNDLSNQSYYLVWFNSPEKWKTDARMASLPENETDRPIAWDKDSPACAYLADEDFDTVYIKTNADAKPIRLTWHGDIKKYVLNKNYLYVAANLTNEPGIWRYDIASGSLEKVLSVRDQPFKYAKNPYPMTGVVTNAAGERKGYFLWQPAGIVPGKKYPLILTQTVPEWKSYPPSATAAGYYFAIIGRSGWYGRGVENWSSDVMNVYEDLAKNPNIDTNRVFLWGSSLETGSLCQLLADKPNLWKGVILPDPGAMPDLESLREKHIFVITGDRADNVKYLIKYQDEALAAGIPLKLIFQEDEGHTSIKFKSARNRTVQFTEFLLQN